MEWHSVNRLACILHSYFYYYEHCTCAVKLKKNNLGNNFYKVGSLQVLLVFCIKFLDTFRVGRFWLITMYYEGLVSRIYLMSPNPLQLKVISTQQRAVNFLHWKMICSVNVVIFWRNERVYSLKKQPRNWNEEKRTNRQTNKHATLRAKYNMHAHSHLSF